MYVIRVVAFALRTQTFFGADRFQKRSNFPRNRKPRYTLLVYAGVEFHGRFQWHNKSEFDTRVVVFSFSRTSGPVTTQEISKS